MSSRLNLLVSAIDIACAHYFLPILLAADHLHFQEAGNLMNTHSYKYSGLCNAKVNRTKILATTIAQSPSAWLFCVGR